MPSFESALAILLYPIGKFLSFLLSFEIFGISLGGCLITCIIVDMLILAFIHPAGTRVHVNPTSPHDTARLGSSNVPRIGKGKD